MVLLHTNNLFFILLTKIHYIIFIGVLAITSCSTNIEEIDKVIQSKDAAKTEKGKNIRIIYSDSARVKVIVNAPEMERFTEYGVAKEVFPKGILIEFLDSDKVVRNWVQAQMAVRDERTQKITATGNVNCYDDNNRRIETSELIYDEKTKQVYTDRLVRLTNPEKGDTTYGFGFRADKNFTRFEIKKKVQGKLDAGDFTKSFEN